MNMLDYIKSEIRKSLNELTDDVINGSCLDYPSYRYECGKAFGLVMAEDIIKEAERKMRLAEGEDPDAEE